MEDKPAGGPEKPDGTPSTAPSPSPSLAQAKAEEIKGADPKTGTEEPNTHPDPPKTRWQRAGIWLRSPDGAAWMMVLLTSVIAFTGVVGIILILRSGGDTQKMITAAQNQAAAAQQFADTADNINENMNDAVAKLDAQAKAIEKSRESSTAASSKSLSESISSSRLDQRAWLGVSDIVIPNIPGSDKQFPVTIILTNSGKTPATKVQKSSVYRYSTVPIRGPSATDIGKLAFSSMQSVAPQGKATMVLGYVSTTGDLSTPSDLAGVADVTAHFQDIQDGKLTLYYFGAIKYEDAFGNQRTTDYCIYIADVKQKIIGFCQDFNDLN